MTLSGEAGLLGGSRLGIAEHAHHVDIILPFLVLAPTFEVARCRFSRRQQKHHSVSKETQARPLLFSEVGHVLQKLILLRFVLWNERHYSLHWVAIDVVKSGPMAHV